MKKYFYILPMLNFLFLLADAKEANESKIRNALKDIKDTIVYPTYLPPSFGPLEIKQDKDSEYIDYKIKSCDQKKNCCIVEDAHEYGDSNLQITDKTLTKKIKTEPFGEVDFYLITAKEQQDWLDGFVKNGSKWPSYKKNVAETIWVSLKNDSGTTKYRLECYGIPNETAIKVLEGLRILSKK